MVAGGYEALHETFFHDVPRPHVTIPLSVHDTVIYFLTFISISLVRICMVSPLWLLRTLLSHLHLANHTSLLTIESPSDTFS